LNFPLFSVQIHTDLSTTEMRGILRRKEYVVFDIDTQRNYVIQIVLVMKITAFH